MVVLSVGDAIECLHATKSGGTFRVPIAVGWRGKVQIVTDFNACIDFQDSSHQWTTTLWVRASEFDKFVKRLTNWSNA